jgi:CRP/FNR family cyclic AMP-dependent transcriptional regulator
MPGLRLLVLTQLLKAGKLSESNGLGIMKLHAEENEAIMTMLEKNPLWAGLDRKDLKAIVKVAEECKFETGDIVLGRGEGGVGFYLIRDGSVEIKSDGKILAKLGPGQFFGEMAILDNQPRSADVVAAEPSRCLIVSEWSFKALISENPKIALNMLQEFARRLREANKSQNQVPPHTP